MFQDREEAGDRLAAQLTQYRDDPMALILALPRGGVAVGYKLSLVLHLPLDVFITRKLGAPGNPEFAMGALAETGQTFFNKEAIQALAVSDEQLNGEIRLQHEEIARRQTLYRKGGALPPLASRTIILTDDGIATGSTFFASVDAIRDLHPNRLIGAIPVGPWDTINRVRRQVDELIVLETPEPFFAVGNHYVDFQQVEDEEVMRYLELASAARNGGERAART